MALLKFRLSDWLLTPILHPALKKVAKVHIFWGEEGRYGRWAGTMGVAVREGELGH